MASRIKIRSGTRAALDAATAASQLIQYEPLFITDEQRFGVATAVNAYTTAAKQGEGGGVYIGSTAPNPENYLLWFDLETGSFLVWVDDGTTATWVEVGSSGGMGFIASATEPDSGFYPLWFDTAADVFKVWVDDGTTATWVEVGSSGLPAGGTTGHILVKASSADYDAAWTDTLTVPLNVPAGASGTQAPRANEVGTLANAQLTTHYKRSNVIGAVSQSGGVPTGALIEKGSNANGSYVRFADGTQICLFTQASNVSINTALTSPLYASSPISMTFPAAFSSVPVCSVSAVNSANAPAWSNSGNSSTTGVTAVYLFSYSNTATARASYIAIGRWYE